MFQRKKLSEDAHRKEKRAANAIRGGVGLGGLVLVAIKNKDIIIPVIKPVVKTVAKLAKTIIFRG